MDLVSTILDGILLGGLYALFAAGLSLIFGVMRLVNIAHGDLIILSAFIALVVAGSLGLHPLACLVFVVPIMASLGYGLQRCMLNRTLGHDILPPLLVTFGLSVFLQNALLQLFSADSRRLHAGGFMFTIACAHSLLKHEEFSNAKLPECRGDHAADGFAEPDVERR